MINISFDNPLLLLVIIPLLLLVTVPHLVAIRHENRTRATTVSLVLHILIVLLASLALAGMRMTTVITKTEVYVVADVSYSSNRTLDEVDGYISEIEENLPNNSSLGVVAFGKDFKIITELGGELSTVKDSGIDDSATDLSSALDYTATLFSEDTIKRIIIISDGKETDTDGRGRLITSIEALYSEGIYVDAIYVDNNLSADVSEVQISDVGFTPATYKNHEASADVLVRASYETEAIASIYRNGELLDNQAVELVNGFNIVNFSLPTDTSGEYDYEVKIAAEGDLSSHNNSYSFTQSVEGEVRVLLITDDRDDLERAKALYGEEAVLDAYVGRRRAGKMSYTFVPSEGKEQSGVLIPSSVEELIEYDEIMLSSLDVREINNYTAFIGAIDTAVSKFGKSLVTVGDLKIQNKTEDVLKQLENMLPVRFGNSDQDPKLYAIVIDSSLSMDQASRLIIAKQAACRLLDILSDNDYVTVVNFWGEINVLQAPTRVKNREDVKRLINGIRPYQGTVIGTALDKAGELIEALPYEEKQIMLISDGMSYTYESDKPTDVATDLFERLNVKTSVINPYNSEKEGTETLRDIASAGGGEYYFLDSEEALEELMFSEIADDVTESVILGKTAINIDKRQDPVLSGVAALPDIYGYAYAKAKASATTPLSVDYEKNADTVIKAPLYSYWNYGEGRVSSFMSSLSGEWTADFVGSAGDIFLGNVLTENIPDERIAYPYTVTTEFDGTYSYVEIIPTTLNPKATMILKVTSPTGAVSEYTLTFDSEKYSHRYRADGIGKYVIEITYSYGERSYTSELVHNVSYSPEYDSFASFDPSELHAAIRNRGTVNEGRLPSLENDEREVATYEMYFTVPLMILSAVLYIVDIIIRKLKWSDIVSFFGKKRAKGGAK
ncbi:MAG: VWA domain-containing protein [Clostridia bacterium]|nr:VWA domain-containing protein [Clostridia bacterium]